MKIRESVYTSKQVQSILALSAVQISRLVEKGVLQIVHEPGYTHHYYDMESVCQYQREKAQFEESHKKL